MSEENVQLTLRAIEEFNDTRSLRAAFDRLIHPEVHFKDEIGEYDNRQEVRDFLEGFAESIGGLHVEIEETLDVGDTVLLQVIQSGRGATSAVPIAQSFTWVMRFDGGVCVDWRIWADRAQALEAVGLSE
jgi:ketosteroid isomerase-like protein